MQKTAYGNIEDMLVRVRMVTSIGTVDRKANPPLLIPSSPSCTPPWRSPQRVRLPSP
jgi:hypothetical protein